MGFFDDTQQALSEGRSVFYGELYEVGFTSGTSYYWDGFGDIDAYGNIWIGRGSFVERSEIPFGVDDEAGELSLVLSGVDDELLAKVRVQESEFVNRPITIWGQFFNEALQLSGNRFFLYGGIMDVPTYGGTIDRRSITVPCEGEWSDRNASQLEFFSHNSQQLRHPGDKGLDFIYRYTQGTKRKWPKFP